jgi:Leucine-rich repeat (LRR) protein
MPDIMQRIAYCESLTGCWYTRAQMLEVCKLWRQVVLHGATTMGCPLMDLYDGLDVPTGLELSRIHTLNLWTNEDEPQQTISIPVLLKFTNLRRLEIYYTFSPGEEAGCIPSEIPLIPSLCELDLIGPTLMSLATISACTQITHLSLDGLKVKDSNLKELSCMTRLRDLCIDSIDLNYFEDSDSDMRRRYDLSHLSTLVHITRLSFNNVDYHGALEVIVDNFKELEVLNYRYCGIGMSFFENGLSYRTNLGPLSACRNLRELSWTWTGIKDLTALAQLSRLEKLDLTWSSELTTDSLRSLSRLSGLQSLVLSHCTQVTCLTSLSVLTRLDIIK